MKDLKQTYTLHYHLREPYPHKEDIVCTLKWSDRRSYGISIEATGEVMLHLPLSGSVRDAARMAEEKRIAGQKTRWGSCSSNKTLSFNWKLMLAPPKVLDYVVVHEICHLREMNHSPRFWALVESLMPDYKQQRKWLKENGHTLEL